MPNAELLSIHAPTFSQCGNTASMGFYTRMYGFGDLTLISAKPKQCLWMITVERPQCLEQAVQHLRFQAVLRKLHMHKQ